MSTATEMVTKYLAAEQALLDGKDVTWNGRRLAMEDLDKIRAGRREWEARVAQESPGSQSTSFGGTRFKLATFSGCDGDGQ